MPPWLPGPKFGDFRDVRRLSDSELKLLSTWAKNGAPQGALKDLPASPEFSDNWHLGHPDLVLAMRQPYVVPADGPEMHRCFVIPIPIDSDKEVTAVEFRPGNRRTVSKR